MATEVLASWVVEMSLAGQQAVEAGAARAREELQWLDEANRAAAEATAAASRRSQAQARAAREALDAGWAAAQRSAGAKLAAADKKPSGFDAASRASLDAMTASVKRFQEAQRAFVTNQLAGQRAIAAGYQMVTGAVMGFVRAGLQGTAEGNLINLRFQQLSRQIANLFLPVINRVIAALDRVVNWFYRLDGRQQANIARWAGMGIAALFAANQLPKVAAGFEMVGAAMKAAMAGNPIGLILVATAAIIGMLASTEKGQAALTKLGDTVKNLLGPALDMLADSLNIIADSLADAAEGIENAAEQFAQARGANRQAEAEQARSANRYATAFHPTNIFLRTVANPLDPVAAWRTAFEQAETGGRQTRRRRQELTPAGGGFESVGEQYRRLTTAAARIDVQQRQLDTQGDILATLRGLFQHVQRNAGRSPPAVGP